MKHSLAIRRCLRALTLALLLAALLLPSMAAAYPAYVKTRGGNLNLRSGASTGTDVIARFPNGTTVDVIDTYGAWNYVRVGGYTGYMNNSYLVSATQPVYYEPIWQPVNPWPPFNPWPPCPPSPPSPPSPWPPSPPSPWPPFWQPTP